MSLRSLESAIAAEARVVFKNRKLRLKDILEWNTGDIEPENDDEVCAWLRVTGVWACIKKEHDKR